jgi:hypothetical protein
VNRSCGDEELENLLCLHDDWRWDCYPEAIIAGDLPLRCDHCDRMRKEFA